MILGGIPMLEIIEESQVKWTVWKVVEDGLVIARFDSRGGYTRADAEAIVNEKPGNKTQTSRDIASETLRAANGQSGQPLHVIVQNAAAEDWELVKDTAGKCADRKVIFDLAFRFGWHAATKQVSET